jgi:hypothetical protein
MNTRRVQDFVVKGKEVFVGLGDSKKTWKLAVRCEGMVIHQVSMEARYGRRREGRPSDSQIRLQPIDIAILSPQLRPLGPPPLSS